MVKANIPGKFETVVVRPRFIWGKGDTVLVPQLYVISVGCCCCVSVVVVIVIVIAVVVVSVIAVLLCCCSRAEMHKAGKFAWISGGAQLTSTTHVKNCVYGLMKVQETERRV